MLWCRTAVITKRKGVRTLRNGESGLQFERYLFGTDCSEWQMPLELDYPAALEYVRAAQGVHYNWDPQKPKTYLAQLLMDAVSCFLLRADREQLHFYVAIGTSLDRDHGTDAFFQIGKTGRIATIDFTVSRKTRSKAHVIIYDRDFQSELALEAKAEQIASRLRDVDMRLSPEEPIDRENLRRVLKTKIAERNRLLAKRFARDLFKPATPERQPERRAGSRAELNALSASQEERIANLKKVLGL